MQFMKASRVPTVWSFLVCCFLASVGIARDSNAETSAPQSAVDRQLLLLLNPATTNVRARQIVQNAYDDVSVRGLLDSGSGLVAAAKIVIEDLEDAASDSDVRREAFTPEYLLSNYLVLTYQSPKLATEALERLQKSDRVLHVSRNVQLAYASTYYLDKDPGESSVGTYQWGTNGGSIINATAAWSKLRGFAQLGMVDQGVFYDYLTKETHPDLERNLRKHFSRAAVAGQLGAESYYALDDLIDEDPALPGPTIYKGHGTHVAGLMSANPQTPNGTGIRGSCPECSLTVMKQPSQTLSMDRAGQLVSELVRSGVQVINLSFGLSAHSLDGARLANFCSASPNDVMCLAISFATNRGVSIVASSGNERAAIQFPANQASVLAVGGTELVSGTTVFWTTGFDSFGNRVTTGTPCPQGGLGTVMSGSNCSDATDVANGRYQFVAPALDILSTFYEGHDYAPVYACGEQFDPAPNSDYIPVEYGTCTGTSMSAPVVSGIVGLMRSANPLLYGVDIAAVLKRRSTGGGSPLSPTMGWGVPLASDAVVAVLSGASISNPHAFDESVRNRLTPLLQLYSSTGRNHFYTTIPQMGTAAINGAIKPSPQYRLNVSSLAIQCVALPCEGTAVVPAGPIQIRKPDGTAPGTTVPVRIVNPNSFPQPVTGQGYKFTAPGQNLTFSDSAGNVAVGMTWDAPSGFSDNQLRSATVQITSPSSFPLQYQSVGNLVSGFSVFPGVPTTGINPRASISVYVSHANPVAGGVDLIPLYRLSRRCGEFASAICDTSGSANYNPFHVSHIYTTDVVERGALLASPNNYKLDGIEGYVFPKSYANAPVAGAVRVCRLRDPNRDELVLFPGTGANGKTCNPPFPSYASGSYYSELFGGTDWIGWAMPNTGGNTPPTVSLTSPANGATFGLGSPITLSASASDSNGIANVKWYANGIQVANDNNSPYSKTWTPSTAGTYTIYAVATDNNANAAQTTSDPRQITVGSCTGALPSLGNSGFETPSVGFGNYDDAPTGATWTFVPAWAGGQSGISGNGSAFTSMNPNAPAGAQVAYVQGANYLRQTINFPSCGTYRLRASLAQRAFSNYSYLNLNVLVDGVDYGSIYGGTNPLGLTNYQTFTSAPFFVSAGNRVVTLQGVNPDPAQDNSIFIDTVQVVGP